MTKNKLSITEKLLLIFSIIFIVTSIVNGISIDNWFIAATGKEILKNGIPKTNPFYIKENYPFVCQQWLFCIIYYLIDCIPFGAHIFTILGIVSLILLSLKLTKTNIGLPAHLIIILMSLVIANDPLVTHRPEWITISLIILQILIQNKAAENTKYLYLLPIIAILEINLHASMWIMHACILAAYILPFYKMHPVLKINKDLILSASTSAAALFLNPYGIDNILYLFNARYLIFKHNLGIREMKPPTQIISILILIITIYLFIKNVKDKKYSSAEIYISAGLILCGCMAARNIMFTYIAMIITIVKFLDKATLDKIKNHRIYIEYKMAVNLLIVILTAGIVYIFIVNSIDTNKLQSKIYQYILIDKKFTAVHDYLPKDDYKTISDMLQTEDTQANITADIKINCWLVYNDIKHVMSTGNIEQYAKTDKDGDVPIIDSTLLIYGIDIENITQKYEIDYIVIPETAINTIAEASDIKEWLHSYDNLYIRRTDIDVTEYIVFESKEHYAARQNAA